MLYTGSIHQGMTMTKTKIESYFRIAEKQTSFSTEFLAGFSTYLSLSYIFVVNPAILSQAGMDKSAVFFATIVASGLATLLMGLWAKLPFVLSPGMEMNAYVAFFVVGAMGFSWQEALGAVFWSGVIFIILTVSRIREKIIDAIPHRMKSGISLSVGIFLMLIALKIPGLLIYDNLYIKGVGNLFSPQALVLYTGIAVVLLLDKLKIRAAVLISIVAAAGLAHLLGIADNGEAALGFSKDMFAAVGRSNLGVIFNPRIISVILVLFLVDFYGSIAKFIGLTYRTNIMEKGKLPGMTRALSIDGAATMFGALSGTTSITTYVESGVGIGLGGRTGLSALVCSLFMFATFLLAPLLHFIPLIATTGALFFVGIKLFPPLEELKSFTKVDIVAMVAMQVVVIAFFSIDRAMLLGFLVYLAVNLAREKVNPYLIASTLLLVVGLVLQISL